VLAEYIVAHSDDFKGKKLVELGSGVGLAGLVAAKYCEKVTLTDRSSTVLQLLQRNINLNVNDLASKECSVSFLEWGKATSEEYRRLFGSLFDLVIGSDIIRHHCSIAGNNKVFV